MTEFVAVISAKGGVGKTTTSINLSSALDYFKRDVIVLDGNFTNPDIGIHLGKAFLPKSFHTALKGHHHINESVYKHSSGLRIIPGNISYNEAINNKKENIVDVVRDLTNFSEVVIIDSSPGIGDDCRAVLKAVDYVLIVTTPDICSVTNSIKTVKLSKDLNKKILGVVVNMMRGENYELSVENIQTMTGQKVVGFIPYDHGFRQSIQRKTPLVNTEPTSQASIGFKKLAANLMGKQYMTNIQKNETGPDFKKILKRFGL